MAEEKTNIKLYSALGDGIIDSGYYAGCSELIQVTAGSVAISVGTEVCEVSAGDFLFVPSDLVFRIEAVGGGASIRGLVFDRKLVEENMNNFDSEINYMFYVQSFIRPVTFILNMKTGYNMSVSMVPGALAGLTFYHNRRKR